MAARGIEFDDPGLGRDILAVERSQGEPEGQSSPSGSGCSNRHRAAVVCAIVVSSGEGLIYDHAAAESAEIRVQDAAGQIAVAVRDEAPGKSHQRVCRGALKEKRVVSLQPGVVGVGHSYHVAVLPK